MGHTKQKMDELIEAGYAFSKADVHEWVCTDGETIIARNRSLGDLISTISKQLNIW